MQPYNRMAGQALRKLRRQRHLTLKQAAEMLNTSAPVLSRKERGEDDIERADVRLAIKAYHLTPGEAYGLWTAAGFVPELTLSMPPAYELRLFVETVLPGLPFPAFVLDMLGYIRAWNQGIEAIWAPSKVQRAPAHVLDGIFSARRREQLGALWDDYALKAVEQFHHRTLAVAGDPAFRKLLQELAARYGPDFVRKWNDAASGTRLPRVPSPAGLDELIVLYGSPYGQIEYLVMRMMFHSPQDFDLYMYVPFGLKNQETYEKFKTAFPESRVYLSPGSDLRPRDRGGEAGGLGFSAGGEGRRDAESGSG